MKILLLGSGGREHAMAWKINQSVWANPLYIAPGNAGTEKCGINVDLDLNDFDGIASFCIQEDIKMVVVGPEEPLVNGLGDFFQADKRLQDIYFIGPNRKAAQLEGSKAFAKSFMHRHNIPTAAYREFTMDNYTEGIDYINNHSLPVVIKADGLAAGKGVAICASQMEAIAEFELMVKELKFGEASRKVVVEEFLSGIEVSVFVITDGKHYITLPEAKDYKRVGKGDKGLNTGGMGAVSPVPVATPGFMHKVEERVIKPTIDGLRKDGIPYKGFIFFGLISVNGDPYVIEYNCRLGDPETEVILPRMNNDLVGLFIATAKQELNKIQLEVDQRAAATVVAVSRGYPGPYEKGYPIEGLEGKFGKQSVVFHAGTKKSGESVVTNGGRVFCVTSFGEDLRSAVESSLEIMGHIQFDGIYYRTDIGYEFIPAY